MKIEKEDNRQSIMKRNIEIKPEWVINTMTDSQYANGNGEATLYTSSGSNATWIELALNTLGIDYEYDEFYYDEDEPELRIFCFDIAQLKDVSPELYRPMNDLDNRNHVFFLNRKLNEDDSEFEEYR